MSPPVARQCNRNNSKESYIHKHKLRLSLTIRFASRQTQGERYTVLVMRSAQLPHSVTHNSFSHLNVQTKNTIHIQKKIRGSHIRKLEVNDSFFCFSKHTTRFYQVHRWRCVVENCLLECCLCLALFSEQYFRRCRLLWIQTIVKIYIQNYLDTIVITHTYTKHNRKYKYSHTPL